MKIIVSPDSFKGSFSSTEFCDVAKNVFEMRLPECEVITFPMADGGEGLVQAMVHGLGGKIVYVEVTGPLGLLVSACYGLLGDGETAVIEMAAASGLPLVPPDKRNPMLTTSYGTGELILQAIQHGAKKVILGLGGSATNDGGVGALQALGYKFVDENGHDIEAYGAALKNLVDVKFSDVDPRLADVEITLASDVTNPLLGMKGATMTYGCQKGADEHAQRYLEDCLICLADVAARITGDDKREATGAGAAGGMGFGFLSFTNASIESGFDVVAKSYQLENILQDDAIDLIITGEGQVDSQSLQGKLVGKVAELGQQNGVPVIVLAGGIEGDMTELYSKGVASISTILIGPMSLTEAMKNGLPLLEKKLIDLCELYKSGLLC